MKIMFVAIAILFVAALYIYFFGTPLVASFTGISPRTISLTAGTAIAILGFSMMMLGKLAAQRGQK